MWHKLVLAFLSASTATCAISINCDYDTGTIWEFTVVSYYRCSVTNLVVTTAPYQTITSITGTHSSGLSSNDQVNYIKLQSKEVNYFPRGLATQFVNIEILSINSCHLKKIDKCDIKSWSNLKVLNLQKNDLESLNSDLLQANTALEVIYLGSNQIKTVGLDIFKPLENFKFAQFSGNICIQTDAYGFTAIAQLKKELNQKCLAYEEQIDQNDCEAKDVEMSLHELENENARTFIEETTENNSKSVSNIIAPIILEIVVFVVLSLSTKRNLLNFLNI